MAPAKLEQEKRNFLIAELKTAMDIPAVTQEMRDNVKATLAKKPKTPDLEFLVSFWKEFKKKNEGKAEAVVSAPTPMPETGPVAKQAPEAVKMLEVSAAKSGITSELLAVSVATKFPYVEKIGVAALSNEDYVLLWEAVQNRAKFDELMAGVRAGDLFNSLGEANPEAK
jgi:hypothetical protein